MGASPAFKYKLPFTMLETKCLIQYLNLFHFRKIQILPMIFQLFFFKGRSAHDLPYLEVERIVEALSFNDASSSFYQSELVLSKLIDYYVPFFPMPEQEVECCILLELAGNKTFEMRSSLEKRAVLDEILKRYNFLPDHNPWYADFGCKSVKKAVNLFDIE